MSSTTSVLKLCRARWVEDGKFLTTAGVSAGIDGGIHLVARLLGDDVAKLVSSARSTSPSLRLVRSNGTPHVEAVRPIWRPPLEEILTAHPHLAPLGSRA